MADRHADVEPASASPPCFPPLTRGGGWSPRPRVGMTIHACGLFISEAFLRQGIGRRAVPRLMCGVLTFLRPANVLRDAAASEEVRCPMRSGLCGLERLVVPPTHRHVQAKWRHEADWHVTAWKVNMQPTGDGTDGAWEVQPEGRSTGRRLMCSQTVVGQSGHGRAAKWRLNGRSIDLQPDGG
eukprot:355181-Chlamydomonas_euryale.AAC.4